MDNKSSIVSTALLLNIIIFTSKPRINMVKTAIIVDDEEAGLGNMERLLGLCDDIEVIAKTKVPEEAVGLITDKKPDILFLDVEMPRMSGFEVLEITRNQGLNPIVIFTTGYNQYAIKAIKAQAFDYLLKPIVLDELKETLSRLSNNSIIGHRLNTSVASLLSPREIEVLEMVVQGRTSKEIAEELFISKTTVDTHRRNLLEKTGCRSTSELLMRVMG